MSHQHHGNGAWIAAESHNQNTRDSAWRHESKGTGYATHLDVPGSRDGEEKLIEKRLGVDKRKEIENEGEGEGEGEGARKKMKR